MVTAVHISTARRASSAMPAEVSDKALGVLLASLVPALFWTAMIAFVGGLIGHSPSVTTLTMIGVSIALFLAVVVGSLVARRG